MVRTHHHSIYQVPDVYNTISEWPTITIETPWKNVAKTNFAEVSNAKIREDPGYPVSTFRDLVHIIAELSYYNPALNLYFRGQQKDITDSKSRSKLYPSIFRPASGQKILRKSRIKKRFQRLKQVLKELKNSASSLGLSGPLSKHPEYWLALIQHYQLCKTPMLDISQSLQVAASFALMDDNYDFSHSYGYLYVIALPHVYGSISKFADDDMVIARLKSICPPDALRPHFQEGLLAGRWPLTLSKEAGDNLAYRLVGKYILLNESGDFFDTPFHPVPQEALLPSDDPFGKKLTSFVNKLSGTHVH